MSKKKLNQNKKILIATIVLIAVIITSCFALMFLYQKSGQSPISINNTAKYDSYQNISSDQLFNLLDETGTRSAIYVGRATCPYCAAWSPKLKEVIQESGALVYYYDTEAARDDNDDKLSELMDRLDVTSVPTLLTIKDGKVISQLDDYESKEAITKFLNE